MKIKNQLFVLISFFLVTNSYGQNYNSNITIEGDKKLVLAVQRFQGQGQLSTGEEIESGCDHGACFFNINYKERKVGAVLGDNFDSLSIYEYDFGGDGDKELIAIFNQDKFDSKNRMSNKTTILNIYRYSNGLIEKIFSTEIGIYNTYKTVIKKDYIEHYLPSGRDAIWHYYLGTFYLMTPVKVNQY